MNEQSLDIFFDKLVQVLFRDVAFYIPSAIFPTNLLKDLQNQIPDGFLNSIMILDTHQGFGVFEFEEFHKRLLLKHTLLEKNIFQLLKKKKELDDFEFNYILKKYFDLVEFYCALVSWLSENLNLYHKNEIDNTTIGCFELQKEFYISHFIELINYFYPSQPIQLKEFYNLSELLKVYFPDLIARYDKEANELMIKSSIEIPQQDFVEGQKNNLTEGKISNEENINIINSKPKKKIKKEPLITEKEIEDFLLSTVFNIKLK